MKYIIANWKANKRMVDAQKWLDEFLEHDLKPFEDKVEIIIAPHFGLLTYVALRLTDCPCIKIAAQDVSFYGAGSYTGEVPAHVLQDYCDYAIIGHAERRKYFHEDNAIVDQKAQNAMSIDIQPIVCVRGKDDLIPKGSPFVAWEPDGAIGTGQNADADNAVLQRHILKVSPKQQFLYGGSVDADNCHEYMSKDEIDGLLIGKASLDADQFRQICLRTTEVMTGR